MTKCILLSHTPYHSRVQSFSIKYHCIFIELHAKRVAGTAPKVKKVRLDVKKLQLANKTRPSIFYQELMRGAVEIRKTEVEETRFRIKFQGKIPQLKSSIFCD